MTELHHNGPYANLNLDDLPGKVAHVQLELQQLEEATQQTKQKVRQAELANQQSHVSQQRLQQQLQQDLANVYTLQMQQADLLALKRAQAPRLKNSSKQAVVQVSLLAIWFLQIITSTCSSQGPFYRTSTKQLGSSSSMLPLPLKPFALNFKIAFNQRRWTVQQQLEQMRLQSCALRVAQHIRTTPSSSSSLKKQHSYLSMASKAYAACIQL